jgi:hypothetical protein
MVYAGPMLTVLAQIEGRHEIQVSVPNEGHIAPHRPGDSIHIQLPPDALRVLSIDP